MAAGYSRLYSYTSPRPEYSTSSCYPCPSIATTIERPSQHGMPMMDVRPDCTTSSMGCYGYEYEYSYE